MVVVAAAHGGTATVFLCHVSCPTLSILAFFLGTTLQFVMSELGW
jgi:hypothetical protein